jgi:uncharacterized membrane protein YeaQ/YmgE (transglycosylase-associated protein family)
MQNGTPSEKTTTNEKSGVKGNLTFDDKVIQKIIGIALSEVDGLLTVDGGFFANVAEKLVNTSDVTSGIDVEGPSLAGMALIPSIIGAIILVLIVSLVVGRTSKK